jgi:hypothetical protein
MPAFLADPPQIVFLLLAAALIVTGLVWLNRRSRQALIAFLAVLLLAGIIVLLDRLFESPREEAVRRVQAMVAAADHRDPEAFTAHVADSVVYQGDNPVTFSRDQLRQHHFWSILRQFNVHIAAWDFSRDDVIQADASTIEIGFLAKGEMDGKQIPVYFRAAFKRQPDGQWKLNRLSSFDPIQRSKPLPVPGLASTP